MSSITCENGPGSPSAFRSGGSKVIRRLLRGRREKPGDEATYTHLRVSARYGFGRVPPTYEYPLRHQFKFRGDATAFHAHRSAVPTSRKPTSHLRRLVLLSLQQQRTGNKQTSTSSPLSSLMFSLVPLLSR